MSNVYINSIFFLPLNSNFEQFPVLKASSALKSTLCGAAGKTVKGWGWWEWGGAKRICHCLTPNSEGGCACVEHWLQLGVGIRSGQIFVAR